jgi:hypothetical protein
MRILNWYDPKESVPIILIPSETRTTSESLYMDLIPNTDFYDLRNSVSFDFWNHGEENKYETDN